MSSCVIAVEPAVSEETDRGTLLITSSRYIVPMTPIDNKHTHPAGDS